MGQGKKIAACYSLAHGIPRSCRLTPIMLPARLVRYLPRLERAALVYLTLIQILTHAFCLWVWTDSCAGLLLWLRLNGWMLNPHPRQYDAGARRPE